jgi:hypothetical protein
MADPTLPRPLSPQQALERAQYVAHVVRWIEDARLTLARLEDARRYEPIRAALNAWQVWSPIDWTEEESNGLQELLVIQQEAMAAAQSALEGTA